MLTRALNAFCERRLRAAAEDVTDASVRRRCLVLAPHPDDETLGCGATIARKRAAGTEVRVLFATDGRHSESNGYTPEALARVREGEARDATRRLGVPAEQLLFLGWEDGTLARREDELRVRLAVEIARFAPEEVYAPVRFDGHADHEALSRAAAAAARARGTPLLEYPVWFWVTPWWRRWARGGFSVKAVRTDGLLDVKREAYDAHRSQHGLGKVDGGRFLRRFFGAVELYFNFS
ncbi:MAG TPA: PIG-L family deacetylase [Planctomycetota bacterium]|nr:PIG-L family deacetylase [Planctomycetota bacterium]